MEHDVRCPECSETFPREWLLTMHCNDVHKWDWLTLARKLGPGALPS
jgi:uncharacterized C2H2 Zn-finger protein